MKNSFLTTVCLTRTVMEFCAYIEIEMFAWQHFMFSFGIIASLTRTGILIFYLLKNIKSTIHSLTSRIISLSVPYQKFSSQEMHSQILKSKISKTCLTSFITRTLNSN
ncbi:CLUMA_CG015481, isoform A [Clunio marinus]|uniref:CLUMA_CG015481, isoform A n=1 Tax=Clunio marinus TaxID=568069 RepID=A0A1J1IRC4_9DIPT|nr:CLUMA_CG015481, isoform A [Clunio marinus]